MAHDLSNVAQHLVKTRHGTLRIVHGLAIFALCVGIKAVGKIARLQGLRHVVQCGNGGLDAGQAGVDGCLEFVHVAFKRRLNWLRKIALRQRFHGDIDLHQSIGNDLQHAVESRGS